MLSGPSGVGKTTVARKLCERPGFTKIVTATTRLPRGSEVDGKDYRFFSRDAFEAGIKRGEFLEYAEIFGNLYGTPRKAIDEALATGKRVVVDIDSQGARSVKALGYPAVFLFIAPPSLEELRKRLEGRKTEESGVMERRLAAAKAEMDQIGLYDAVIVNETVDGSLEAIMKELKKRKVL